MIVLGQGMKLSVQESASVGSCSMADLAPPETALRMPVTGLGGVLSDLLSLRVILEMAPPNPPPEPLLAAAIPPAHNKSMSASRYLMVVSQKDG